jgi:hypothetical protein
MLITNVTEEKVEQVSAGFLLWDGKGPIQADPRNGESLQWVFKTIVGGPQGQRYTAAKDPEGWMQRLCYTFDGMMARATQVKPWSPGEVPVSILPLQGSAISLK